MPRSSKHKSHRQSKHSSKDDRENTESEEDVKMKDKNGNEEGSVRSSRDFTSGEKRKVASQSLDGKDPSAHGNGDTSEEHVVSKRRKEKVDAAADSDRWNGGGDERGDGTRTDKEAKGDASRLELDRTSKLKASVDSKGRSSRRNEKTSEKKEENASVAVEKDEGKSGGKVDLKRRSEKDFGRKEVHQGKDKKEVKDKERGAEREKKAQDIRRDVDAQTMDGKGKVAKKQASTLVVFGEEPSNKRGRDNTESLIQDELRNPELEQELEKRIRKRRDGSSDKYQDNASEDDDKRLSLKGEHGTDGRHKDERHKDKSHGDKYQEDDERDDRHRDNKHREGGDRDNRTKDDKYRKDGIKDNKRKEDKYREDAGRDSRQRDDKYREDGERDRRRDDKYREEGERDSKHRDDRRRDDRYHEDGDGYNIQAGDKNFEDGERDRRHREDKYWKEGDRLSRHTEDKNQEDVDKESRHRNKLRDDVDRDKRLRDVKYWEERTVRDQGNEKSSNRRMRDESSVGELHYRKSNNRDGSPFDEHSTRYRDDKGRRRGTDKEDKDSHGDIRHSSIKEQQSDAGKKSTNTAKVEIVTDRGRSYSRNADADISLNRNKRRSSPSSSSHTAKDQYRLSKQEGSKYRDYMHEERAWHDMAAAKEIGGGPGLSEKMSLSQSLEKPSSKDESHLVDLSVERRQRSQLVDKSPSSSSNDRRHLSESGVRRSLDIEEYGQKSGGMRDTKEYSEKEGRGSPLPVDELSQADGDTLSVSSPFIRPGRIPNSSRSLLPPPPPYRTGGDNSSMFGSLEDDKRGKSINRHRKPGESNMGRAQGSPWKGVPNWPSSMANGFIPFQHGPPPLGFHPVMHQFPAPPMFGVRPSMELNHTGVSYHIPDADRFSVHGRPLGWRNPVDESYPAPPHGWESNHAVFGEESHMYGRPEWDQNRTLNSGRGWEGSGDMWKGHNGGVKTELPSAPQKQDYSARGPVQDVWISQTDHQSQKEQNQPSLVLEKVCISQSGDDQVPSTHEVPKTVPEKISNISETQNTDSGRLWRVYLSKLDLSADLTQPELYSQCVSLINMDQNNTSDKKNSNVLYVEEASEAKVIIPDKISTSSLFAAVNDSVFQKAILLYKEQRKEIKNINAEKLPCSSVENLELMPPFSHQEKVSQSEGKSGERDLAGDLQEADEAISQSIEIADIPIAIPKSEDRSADEPVQPNSLKISEDPVSELNEVKMEVDPIVNEDTPMEYVDEDKSMFVGSLVQNDGHPFGKVEEVVKVVRNSHDSRSANNNSDEEQMLVDDTKCGSMLFSDVSSEAVMPEFVESGSVNLSRIHHSPESTH